MRDRRSFTKQMLRSFIKNTVTRDSWTGAPWLVKENIAVEYRIDTEVPPHLQYSTKAAERKLNAAAKRAELDGLYNFPINGRGLPELKPAIRGKPRLTAEERAILAHGYAGFSPEQALEEYQRSLQANSNIANPIQTDFVAGPAGSFIPSGHVVYPQPNGHYVVPASMPPPQPLKRQPSLPPPPPIKYPIEDMDIAPEHDGSHRPNIKFLCGNPPSKAHEVDDSEDGIRMESVGLLLETWTTLNAYCEVFQLDSFTLDDFVEAMQFSSTDSECELLTEIHCAVLKRLVNGENDQNGSIQISLPDFPQDDDEEEDESQESSRIPTPSPEPESPPRRTTRSSLNKQLDPPRSRSATAERKVHRAGEMFTEYTWLQRLRKRDFKNGGWQMILVGLLHHLSSKPTLRDTCDSILAFLAPLDADPVQDTVLLQYTVMDVNLRVNALQIITMLTMETKAIKLYLEQCAAQMTEYRKEKIEYQRARKAHMEELRKLHEERKILAPEAKSPSPPPELKADENGDIEMTNEIEDSEADSDDEDPLSGHSLRRGHDRAAERKRKREEEQDRKERAEAAKKTKGTREYLKTLKRIEEEQQKIRDMEAKILEMDIKLRRTDKPRIRILGRDRFWNRYLWFERNAMPFEGTPESSTAYAGYSNGRLWVQGPDDMEREGFIDVPPPQQKAYSHNFGITPLTRKSQEEGFTSVFDAYQWGYIDDAEALDELIAWLDTRGIRETKLRKELLAQKDLIAKYMHNRADYLAEPGSDSNDSDSDEEPVAPTRMSTRRKVAAPSKQATEKHLNLRCMRWTNETAVREIGCRHMDGMPPPSKRAKGKKKKKEPVVEETEEEEAPRGVSTRLKNRQGKPLTRQGSRYAF